MATYLPWSGDPMMPPPYRFKGVSIWSFPLKADIQKLTAVVDRYLNRREKGAPTFRPLAPLVYMMVLDYDRMWSMAPQNTWGYLTQKEFYFSIPVKKEPLDVGLFVPYIFVDNPLSLITGNMVLGFPKQLAWFHLPSGARQYPIHIDSPVFVKSGPDTPLTWQRLVTIENAYSFGLLDGAEELLEEAMEAGEMLVEEAVETEENLWPFGPIDDLFGSDGSFSVAEQTLQELHDVRDNKLYKSWTLKQIPGVNCDDSCYSAIIELSVGLSSMPRCFVLPPARVDLPSYASAAFGKDLGLARTAKGPVVSIGPYRLRCDFEFKDPVILWPAGS